MSFYTSLNGLKNAQTDLGVIAHNIANVETTGFKKSRVEFSDIVAGSAYSNPKLIQGIGATVSAISQNFALGPIEQTGSALDLTINGDGFFTTKAGVTGQTYYTRNGSFVMDELGFIHDGENNRLQVFPVDPVTGVSSSLVPQDVQVPAVNGAGSNFAGVTVRDDGNIVATYADGTNMFVELAGQWPFGHSQLRRTWPRPIWQAAVGRARALERRYRRRAGRADYRPAQFPGQRQGDRYGDAALANHH